MCSLCQVLPLKYDYRSPEMDTVRLKPSKKLEGFCAVRESKYDHKQPLAPGAATTVLKQNHDAPELLFAIQCGDAKRKLNQ